MARLGFSERPPTGEPDGLLVLAHGRGSDDSDMLGLADVFDPERRLHVVAPRAPLRLPGIPGHHWYVVPRVGYPDPATFRDSVQLLAELHDELWERTGLTAQQTVLGGFSQGTVMSYALGLAPERPAPAGILALSGFVPTVDGWKPELGERARGTHVLIAHGSRDPVIEVSFAREAHRLLSDAGADVSYHESETAHHIDPRQLPAMIEWLATVTAR